jgi:hypothetical protein
MIAGVQQSRDKVPSHGAGSYGLGNCVSNDTHAGRKAIFQMGLQGNQAGQGLRSQACCPSDAPSLTHHTHCASPEHNALWDSRRVAEEMVAECWLPRSKQTASAQKQDESYGYRGHDRHEQELCGM